MDGCYPRRRRSGAGLLGAAVVCCPSCMDQGDFAQKDALGLRDQVSAALGLSLNLNGAEVKNTAPSFC